MVIECQQSNKKGSIMSLRQDLTRKDYERAALLNQEITESLKSNEEAAKELLSNREYEKAVALCEEAEALAMKSALLYDRHAVALVSAGRWQEASELINDKLQVYPEEPPLYHAKAFLLIKEEKYKDALAVCNYAKSHQIWDGSIAAASAVALLRLKEYKLAIAFIQRELKKYPEEISLHFSLTAAYWITFRWLKCLRECKNIIALDRSQRPLFKVPLIIFGLVVAICVCFILSIVAIILEPSATYLIMTLSIGLFAMFFVGIRYLRFSFQNRQIIKRPPP